MPLAVLSVFSAVATAAALLPGPADAGSGRLERREGSVRAATAKLGVTYGPYLGKRCRDVAYPRCELIGIDIVFSRTATRVEAIAGTQRIRLRTPGEHSGVPRHDWVGRFTATDLARTHDSGDRDGELLYAPVQIRVRFAGGHLARAVFPHVLVAPGWG
ncbi:MAG TPA: hypothetical protein VHZ54_19505 [Solirubrobacterales bacterium]|nr:hypothetical protein [Solirubrobacterales bacterium]